ncbi:MAG: aromatic ring-hydroxylating dioxygenase subunit alpha [Pseudomonadales bacterium]
MTSAKEFAFTPADKAPDPELGSDRIPVDRYTNPQIMLAEDTKLWAKTWLLAGAASDVAQAGDYFVFENLRESILVVRGDDGVLRAFYNVCQHRGNQLRPAGCGFANDLTCGFHKWQWHLDGTLKHVPEAHDFPQGTPAAELGLQPLSCDTWGGFVWVSMDPEIEPLLNYLGVIPEHLAPYEFDDMVLVSDETVEWSCNWKTSVDIFSETYHVRGVHPESEDIADDVNVQMDLYGPHSRFIAPMYIPSPRKIDPDKSLNPTMVDYLNSEGFPVADYEGDVTTLRSAVAAHKRAMMPSHGLDFSKLTDDQLTADYHYNVFPNITFNLFGEQMWMFRHRPHPSDPNKMYFDRMIFNRVPKGDVSASANAGAVDMFVELGDEQVDGRPVHQFYRHGERSSGMLLDQDASCLEGVQKGLHSRGMKGFWISHHERRIRNFHHWWERYLEA